MSSPTTLPTTTVWARRRPRNASAGSGVILATPGCAAGAGDLEWVSFTSAVLHAVSVEESGGPRATWAGTLDFSSNAGTPEAVADGIPDLRTPGGTAVEGEPLWRVLVEEHELLDADDPASGESANPPLVVPRLVYADTVVL